MKPTYTLAISLLLMLGLSACSSSIKADMEIRADLRHEIDSLNKYVITAFRERQPDRIWNLASDDLRRTDSMRYRLRTLVKSLAGLKLATYFVEHQLYSNKFRADSTTYAIFREGSEHEYAFGYYQPGLPTIATFVRIPEDYREFGLVTSYSNIDGRWRLTSLQFGMFRVLGMDAVDWHYRAKQQDDAGDQIDALIQQNMAMATLRPGGLNIRYRMRDEIERQQFDIASRAKNSFTFPIRTNPADNGAPQIIGASLECDSGGCIPIFSMISNTPISDTAAVRTDCEAVVKNLDHWFSGVSNRNKVVAFRVTNSSSEEADGVTLRVPTVAAWRY